MKKAVGYHGTDITTARKIAVNRDSFNVKHNQGDWLGPGVYFWQDGPTRAWFWAKQKFGRDAAVVCAEISLNSSLDLLDLVDFAELMAVEGDFEQFAQGVKYEQRPLTLANGVVRLPKDRKKAFLNDRDQALLEFAMPVLEKSRRRPIESLRCSFLWGRAVHRSSALFDWANVQICVREAYVKSVIKKVKLIECAPI